MQFGVSHDGHSEVLSQLDGRIGVPVGRYVPKSRSHVSTGDAEGDADVLVVTRRGVDLQSRIYDALPGVRLLVERVGLAFEDVHEGASDGEVVALGNVIAGVDLAVFLSGGGILEHGVVCIAFEDAILERLGDVGLPVAVHFGEVNGQATLEAVGKLLPLRGVAFVDDVTTDEGFLIDVDHLRSLGQLTDHGGVDVLLVVILGVIDVLDQFASLRVGHIAPRVGDDGEHPDLHDLGGCDLVFVVAIIDRDGCLLRVGVKLDDAIHEVKAAVEAIEVAVVHGFANLIAILLRVVTLRPILTVGEALAGAEPVVVDVVHHALLGAAHKHV